MRQALRWCTMATLLSNAHPLLTAPSVALLQSSRFNLRTPTLRDLPRAVHVYANAAASVGRQCVVTDMDETLISKKSTGYIISFLVAYKAWVRLVFGLPFGIFLIPISKVSRPLAVRILYWLAFRGIRVDKAKQIAGYFLAKRYIADLQDPATSAILAADEKVVITASPEFMAKPWLEKHLGVPPANVFGAVLAEKNGRFTGSTGDLPIGEKKVELLQRSPAAMEGVSTVGYGDHPTDLPFLQACNRGVIVHEGVELPEGIDFEPATPFDAGALPTAK